MKIKNYILGVLLLSTFNTANAARPDHHGPIGVMRDHVHKKGEVMGSYRYNFMEMQGLRVGDDEVSSAATTSTSGYNYMVAPTKMKMQMHMAGLMYGLSDNITLSAMSGLVIKDMDHLQRNGNEFKREAEGISDTQVNASYQFYNANHNRAQFNLGVSLPTADINEQHGGARLPYAMQLGSGSYELLPGISFASHLNEEYSFGAQINGVFRLDANKYGYKLGDKYNVTSWVSKVLTDDISVSTRLDYNKNEAIEGVDSTLNSVMIPTANSSLYAGERLDILFGINLHYGFAFEYGVPIYQRIDGPMLETDYKFTLGWRGMF